MAVFTPTSMPVAADETRPRRRFRPALPLLLVILLLDTAYLTIANHASGPPRIPFSAFAYEGSLLLHLGLGVAAVWALARRIKFILQAFRERQGAAAVFGALTAFAFALCLVTGLAFLGIGFQLLPLNARPPMLRLHEVATVAFLVFGAVWLILRARKAVEGNSERTQARVALRLGLLFGAPFVLLLAYTIYAPTNASRIVNPFVPPMTASDEGDGKDGKFFPASVQSVDKQFFPSEYFVDSKSCGVAGCHPDIYAQWNSSAHHLSSFNNQWYRKAIEYMQEVSGVQSSKWCGGCHDMAVLLTEDPKKPGKSRFDTPIAAHDFPADKYPESHAGIGCAVCHSIVHVKSTMGNSDYLADYPPMHKYIITDNAVAKSVQKFLTRLAPEPHKKTFLRPIHTDQTAKFCSSCHKVHLDVPVNGYRWFRGFNDYDSWQGSGVSGYGAVSFYYPSNEKTGQPAFKKCADCHMPNLPSQDAGNFGGQVHSHRFPGANTALPFVYHDAKQMETTVKFLQDKALSIDIFALRRRQEATAGKQKPGGTELKSAGKLPGDAPQAASLNGDSEGPITAASNASTAAETLTAPLNRGGAGAAFRRGESPLVEVVVRTLKLGHAFPGGTIDAVDCWVELEAKDETGRVIYHSGKLQWDNGPVEDGAEKYRSLLVDGHSNPIFRRNAWAARAVVYAKVIPPGAADAVHFRLSVPKDCGKTITLTAKLNYRKFNYWNSLFAYAGRTQDTVQSPAPETPGAVPVGLGYGKKSGPVGHGWDDRPAIYDGNLASVSGPTKAVPNLPITILAQDQITLPVVDATAAMETPAVLVDDAAKKKDRMRWNDYGIGLLLQGDFLHATRAFEQVTKVAPKWPEGYVNIGRVRQAERDSHAAQTAFEQAFALYKAAPTPMTPYQEGRTRFFYAQTQFDQGKLEESLTTLAKVVEVFPEDRNVRNLTGTILFRLGRYDEAITHLRVTLSIDPEDIAAHYNLMKCYRGKGDLDSLRQAGVHEALYRRFKADETTTDLLGPYQRAHPADNNLAQRIHEHADAIVHAKPDWLVRQEQAAKRAGL